MKQGDSRKLDVSPLYLSGDAKLWWGSRQSGCMDGVTVVKSWDEMAGLRKQFLSNNSSWIVRGKLKELIKAHEKQSTLCEGIHVPSQPTLEAYRSFSTTDRTKVESNPLSC